MNFLAVYENPNIKIGDGLFISLISIVLVFVILFVIVLNVDLLHVIFKNKKDVVVEEQQKVQVSKKSTEIKDEDMMVAALIATVEFNNETKEDAKLVSIKQIG